MAIQDEHRVIKEKNMRMCEYMARINSLTLQRELLAEDEPDLINPAYMNRSALALKRVFTLHGFIMSLADRYFRLMKQVGKGDDFGLEGLKELHDFLDEYSALLADEYNWCK